MKNGNDHALAKSMVTSSGTPLLKLTGANPEPKAKFVAQFSFDNRQDEQGTTEVPHHATQPLLGSISTTVLAGLVAVVLVRHLLGREHLTNTPLAKRQST